MKSGQRFYKSEHLKSRKKIKLLFSEGKSLHSFPIRVKYRLLDNSNVPGTRVTFSAPKRNLKRAVDRNKMKRRMREAYRQVKSDYEPQNGPPFEAMFILSSHKLESYHSVKKATIELMQRLANLRAATE